MEQTLENKNKAIVLEAFLRRRLARAGAKGRLGYSLRARGGPVHQECSGHRLEVEAELVHRGHE